MTFRLSKETYWGGSVLQAGDYTVLVSLGDSPVVTIRQQGSDFAETIAPSAVPPNRFYGDTRLEINDEGDSHYVASLYVKQLGAVLRFPPPGAVAQLPIPVAPDSASQVGSSDDAAPPEGALFAIRNTANQDVPQAQAEAIYLSACKIVEQEFARNAPVRPKLTLVLGAKASNVYYPKREIQLAKWDKYQFAQGVIILAVEEFLTAENQGTLAKLAVTEADSTVDVSTLRNEKATHQIQPLK